MIDSVKNHPEMELHKSDTNRHFVYTKGGVLFIGDIGFAYSILKYRNLQSTSESGTVNVAFNTKTKKSGQVGHTEQE